MWIDDISTSHVKINKYTDLVFNSKVIKNCILSLCYPINQIFWYNFIYRIHCNVDSLCFAISMV